MKTILTTVFLLLSFQLYALDLYLANWNVYTDSPPVLLSEEEREVSRLIYKTLNRYDFGGYLVIKPISTFSRYAGIITKSVLDASELCEQTGIDFLVYGVLKKTESYYDAELRIFDNQKKEVRKVIYAKAGLTELPVLVTMLSSQALAYLKELFGLTSKIRTRNEAFSGLYFTGSAGYWLPAGDWGTFLTGLFFIDTGISLLPTITPPSDYFNHLYLSLGLFVTYKLGISKPGFEQSYLNSLLIRLPLEVLMELAPQHVFKAGIQPLFQLDMLVQNPILTDGRQAVASAFGLGLVLGYQYYLSEKRDMGLGITPGVDCIFWDKALVVPRCQVDFTLRLTKPGKGTQQ